jgi:uncharacterized membrane protein (DUF106 family)
MGGRTLNEWTVVTVIVVMVGLIASILKPLISLNSTMTRLTEAVDRLEQNVEALTGRNSESHARLWRKSEAHEERLNDHETRLKMIEHTEFD